MTLEQRIDTPADDPVFIVMLPSHSEVVRWSKRYREHFRSVTVERIPGPYPKHVWFHCHGWLKQEQNR